MKKIEAIVQPFKMEEVKEALKNIALLIDADNAKPDSLDAVLRIARDADHDFVDGRNFLRTTRRRGLINCITHGTSD